MSTSAESEARRALNRLLRGVEKTQRELSSLEGALRHAEGDDFPADAYAEISALFDQVRDFAHEEGRRLQRKVLMAGGIEPGRIRRSSS